jgi:hypothetical protein
MDSAFGPVILGVFIIILGLSNMKGNISSVHRYHRSRVSEADRLPFGRMIGAGTIICGVSLMVSGCLSLLAEKMNAEAFTMAGSVILITGLAAGLLLSFYAMIKYNKGIF